MCQHCVEVGRYTQEEYDQRILNGDTNVMPLMDMDIEKAIDLVASLTADAILQGVSVSAALEVAQEMLDEIRDAQAARDKSPT